MYLYHLISFVKFVLGLLILLVTYMFINVYEDPIVGISLGMLGIFVASRGLSFYLFLGIQKLFRDLSQTRLIKDSYKLSLLFGIYVLINALFLLLGYRSIFLGLLFFVGFVVLQIALFAEQKKGTHEFPEF